MKDRLDFADRILRATVCMVTLAALCACEISYKRGASPTAMAEDEQSCRTENDSSEAYQNCMKNLGWFISSADPMPQLAALANNKEADISVAELQRELKVAPAASGEPSFKSDKASKALMPAPQKNGDANSVKAPQESSPAENNRPVREAQSQPAMKVSSWWKFGGSPQQLASDQQKCRAALGEENAGDGLLVSGTMYQCMRKLGWFGI